MHTGRVKENFLVKYDNEKKKKYDNEKFFCMLESLQFI